MKRPLTQRVQPLDFYLTAGVGLLCLGASFCLGLIVCAGQVDRALDEGDL